MSEITVTLDADGRGTLTREGVPAQLVRADDLANARTKALVQLRKWAAAAGPIDALIQEPSSSFRVRVYSSGKVEPIAPDPADEPRPALQDMPPVAPGAPALRPAPQPWPRLSDARWKFMVVAIISFVALGMVCLTVYGILLLQSPLAADLFSVFSLGTAPSPTNT
ncbi:MAG: hypothetical protein JF592_18430 [Microbacterium sp.]|uniref:hypothetical protein n=1 Tax=Microbacterium sp. TaxID=51671 RepID=UPI001DF0305B|nr:hypothetical protein [Microbacterium sp.]MBW8764526.1 hypothetical protein [Microbacterium sp.]